MVKKWIKCISAITICLALILCVLFLLGNHFRFVSDKEELSEILGYDLSNFTIEEAFSCYDSTYVYSSTVGVVLDCDHDYFDSFLEIYNVYPEKTVEIGFDRQFSRYSRKGYDDNWEDHEALMALGILNSTYPYEALAYDDISVISVGVAGLYRYIGLRFLYEYYVSYSNYRYYVTINGEEKVIIISQNPTPSRIIVNNAKLCEN